MPDKISDFFTINSQIQNNKVITIALWFVIGMGIFNAAIGLILLIFGEFGAFFGLLVVGLAFAGLGWAGRQLLLPKKDDTPLNICSPA